MSSPNAPLTPPSSSDSEYEAHTSDDECDRSFLGSSSAAGHQSRAQPTSSPHPFAASNKANRAPPLYEKKIFTPPPTPPELPKKTPNIKASEVRREESRAALYGSLSLDERTQSEWDIAISSAVDGAIARIDLSDRKLTHIPPSIIDLKNLVVLPKAFYGLQTTTRGFKRSATAPALLPSLHIAPTTRRFQPTPTFAVPKSATASHRPKNETYKNCEIELYLMCNKIRALPRELFSLDGLVVLSLRQNKLTSLPPAIGKLTCLRELNIASNLLTYLPAEILKLELTSLHLHPNKFCPPPPHTEGAEHRRTLGTLSCGPSVPALSELMLRLILAPETSDKSLTWLEAQLSTTQTIDSLSLPDHFQRIVKASTGHGLASEKGTDAEDDVTGNICESPVHTGLLGTRVSNNRFCTPVETRLEWVSVVAGVKVAETLQARVPVLWRGCSKGCLAFLEEAVEEDVEDNAVFVAGTGEEGEPFEFSDEE